MPFGTGCTAIGQNVNFLELVLSHTLGPYALISLTSHPRPVSRESAEGRWEGECLWRAR